jgi:phospholipid/cholesterol/gamma-HCH transport system permease protein
MVLAVQAFNQFRLMHIESRLGAVINASVLTELGPVLAATMLAGRIGSAMAAELATMKVTEQIDGLRALGVDPTHYLAVPRLVACIVLIPLLTSIADFMGVLGGALVAVKINHVAEFHYWQHSRETVELWDIGNGLVKSLFFGVEIAVISCFCGFRAGAGAEGVGRAATEAFVYSFVAILVSDFFLGMFINSLYMSFWPVTTSKLGG